MTGIKFIIGITSTGFDAYYEHQDRIVAVTTGDTITELKINALESYNLYAEESGKKLVKEENIIFEYDVPSFFDYYKVINASAFGERIGMSKSLLSQYVNGVKKPSEKQVKRILAGIKNVGKELSELELT